MERAGDAFMFEGEARHRWEHGFHMPSREVVACTALECQTRAKPLRRVTLTMRWYRTQTPQELARVARWRAGGSKQTVYVQLVPHNVLSAQPQTAPAAVQLHMFALPADYPFERLCGIVADRMRLPSAEVTRLVWRAAEEQPVHDEASWRRVCADYLQTRRMRPVLQLRLDLRPCHEAQGDPMPSD